MISNLKNLGLSENEARVYLAMMELGPSTMLEISAKASVNRPTAYVQIEALKKRGLVSTHMRGKKTVFIAEAPSQLEFMLDHELKAVEEKKSELAKVLGQLELMHAQTDSKPIVRYFEGREGILKMQDDLIKSTVKEVVAISAVDDLIKIFPDHPKKLSPRRVQKGIYSRFIYTSVRGAFLDDTGMLRESRFIAPEKLPFNLDLAIYGDVVAISDLKGSVSGISIRNKDIAKSFTALFELLWALAGSKN